MASSGVAPFDTTLIGNSVWLDGSADGLTAPSSTFSAQDGKEFTLGTWFQLTELDVSGALFCAGANPYTSLRHDSDNKIYFQTEAGSAILKTQAVFRDIGWYHVLVSVDTTQSAAGNRVRLFVNGTEQTLDGTQPSINHAYEFNTAVVHEVGDSFENGAFEGYLAQSFMIGSKSIQQGDFAITDFLDTFTFGTNGSQFIPKKHTEIKTLVDAGSSNSFLLQYENSSALGTDSSTNTNTFTATSMGSVNQSLNSPSKVYTTWNPLDSALDGHNTDMALSEGNTVTENGNGAFCRSTFSIPEGLFSYRVTVNDSENHQQFGVALNTAVDLSSGTDAVAGLYTVSASNGQRNTNGSGSSAVSGYSWSDGDTMEVYVSRSGTTYKIWYGKNGTLLNNSSGSQGDPSAGTNELFSFTHTEDVFFGVHYVNSGTKKATTDFGQRGYSPAEGALTLSTPNIPAPDFQGIDYFDVTLYEGNGGGQRVGDFVPFTDAYTVTNSVMFDDGDSRSLSLNPSSSATSSTVAAISLWLKLGNLSTYGRPYTIRVDGNNYFGIAHDGDDKLSFVINNGGATILNRTTTRIFKDTSAWHNLVVIINQGNGTQADRVKIFYDGVQISNDSTNFSPNTCSLDGSSALNFLNDSSAVHDIGGGVFSQHYDGYVAEVVFLDGADSGSKLDATPFGQVDTSTNRWVAKDPSSYTFGNMGYYLEFKVAPGTSNGAGTDTSGRDNHFTSNGSWATSDQFTDAPSKNFATIDPVMSNGATPVTLSEGNLTGVKSSSGFQQAYSNFSGFRLQENTGIYFAEVLVGSDTSNFHVGVLSGDPPSSTNRYLGQDSNTYGYDRGSGRAVNSGTYASYGASYTAGDVIGIEIDTNTGSINFHKNGADQGQAFTGVSGPYAFAFASESGGGPGTFNFGQQMVLGGSATTFNAAANGRFKHTPPTGAKALNQDNLDDTASKITAWAWIKNRDTDDNHMLFDRVRGVGEDLQLFANSTVAEATDANTLQRFLQRGVQVGNDAKVNTVNESYVLWQWLAGDSATTGTVIPADNPPSIASTVITADAGHFSVGTFTGAGGSSTIGHGLSAAPEFFLVKRIGTSGTGWFVYSKDTSDPNNKFLRLQTGGIEGSASGAWTPGATTMGLNESSLNGINTSGVEHLFIAFRSVPGVCKLGSYTGNGSSSAGPYISLGFKPKWLFIKRNDSTTDATWWTLDTVRDNDGNPTNHLLRLNQNNVEGANNSSLNTDFLADGFKLRSAYTGINASNGDYLYMAMADIGGNGTLPPIYGR